MEGLVFGWRIHQDIDKNIKTASGKDNKKVVSAIERTVKAASKKSGSEIGSSTSIDTSTLISSLRSLMSSEVGILRDGQGLEEAKEFVDFHIGNHGLYDCKDKNILEFANMLNVAGLIIKSASIREESRGTHMRSDFPDRDDKKWKKHIILKKDKVSYKKVD
jgi:succinate dehydrogenase/fumarate reductase flavoprotein subunit